VSGNLSDATQTGFLLAAARLQQKGRGD
jgi:hypothetical protein